MIKLSTTLAALSLLTLPALADEKGFYVTGAIGYSSQLEDVSAIGQNLAIDPTFPSSFEGGDGISGIIGLGYRMDNIRLEGRLGMRNHEFDQTKDGLGDRSDVDFEANGELDTTTITLEIFYDFHNSSSITPYLKAGIGYGDSDFSTKLGGSGVADFDAFDGDVDGFYDAYADGSESDFIWLLGVGASVPLNQAVTLFAEYQFSSLGTMTTGQDDFTDGFQIDDSAAHDVFIGIRYSF